MLLQILDSSRSLEIGRVLFILQPSFQKQHGPRISTAWWLNHLFLSRGEFFEVGADLGPAQSDLVAQWLTFV